MNWKTILFGIVLIDFVAFTLWAFTGQPWREGLEAVFASPWNLQVAADLGIAVAIGIGWMWRDARQQGLNPLPYAVASMFLGSIGLLAYLVRRNLGTTPARTPARIAA